MMTCGDAQLYLSAYFDGELDTVHRQGVATHMAGCPACKTCLEDFSRIRDVLQSGRKFTIPRGLWRQIADATFRPRRRLRLRRWLLRTGAVAAGFTIYVLGHAVMTSAVQSRKASQLAEVTQVEDVLQEAALALAGRGLAGEGLSLVGHRPELVLVGELEGNTQP